MTPLALLSTLRRLSLTQHGAARLLGVEPRTMRAWLAAERGIPEPIARLLWLMEHVDGVREGLEETALRTRYAAEEPDQAASRTCQNPSGGA